MISADDAADLLRDFGSPVTLRRLPSTDVTCQAMVNNAVPAVSPGNVAQFRRRIVIGSTEITDAGWPAPPQRGDEIIQSGKTMRVEAVRSANVGTGTVFYELDTLGN